MKILELVKNEKIANEIGRHLEKNKNDYITQEEIKKIKSLDLNNCKINDLTVLENFANLEYLSLEGNEINDITPLQKLVNLKTLDISDNDNIEDLKPLKKLINLKMLFLRFVPANKRPLSNLKKNGLQLVY